MDLKAQARAIQEINIKNNRINALFRHRLREFAKEESASINHIEQARLETRDFLKSIRNCSSERDHLHIKLLGRHRHYPLTSRILPETEPVPTESFNFVQEANTAPPPPQPTETLPPPPSPVTNGAVHAVEIASNSRPDTQHIVAPHTAPAAASAGTEAAPQPLNFRSRTVCVTDQLRSRTTGPTDTQRLESLTVDRHHRRGRRLPLPDRMQHFYERLDVTKSTPGTRVNDYRETSAYRRSRTLSKMEWCDRRRRWDPLFNDEADSIVSESEFGDGRWWMTDKQRCESNDSEPDEESRPV